MADQPWLIYLSTKLKKSKIKFYKGLKPLRFDLNPPFFGTGWQALFDLNSPSLIRVGDRKFDFGSVGRQQLMFFRMNTARGLPTLPSTASRPPLLQEGEFIFLTILESGF